jgi:stress response protein SCP2
MNWRELTEGTPVPLQAIDVDLARECHLRLSAPGAVPDLVAMKLGPDGRVGSAEDVVFYNMATSADGSVAWMSESPQVQWLRVLPQSCPPTVSRIVVGAAGGVLAERPDAIVRLDVVTAAGIPCASVDSAGEGVWTALELIDLTRDRGGWSIRVTPRGFGGGVAEFLATYGVETDDSPSGSVPVPTGSAPTRDANVPDDTAVTSSVTEVADLEARRRRLTIEVADLASAVEWRRTEVAALEKRLADLRAAIDRAEGGLR